jgi:hypothetical protein
MIYMRRNIGLHRRSYLYMSSVRTEEGITSAHSLQKGRIIDTKQWDYSIVSRLIYTLLNLEIEVAGETY